MFNLISIILLSLNGFEFTNRVFETLVETRGAFETILVDNGSQMETVQRLHALEASPLADQLNLRCMFNDHNRGIASGRNQGASIATGDCLLFLDNDVEIVAADWLERLLEMYATSPRPGVVGGTLLNPDRTIQFMGGTVDRRGSVCFKTEPGEDSPFTMYCLGACFSTPRYCWEAVGGFDTTYDPMDYEDIDYCLRAQQLGHTSMVAPESRLVHYGHVTTGTTGFNRLRCYLSSGRKFRRRWEHLLPESHALSGN